MTMGGRLCAALALAVLSITAITCGGGGGGDGTTESTSGSGVESGGDDTSSGSGDESETSSDGSLPRNLAADYADVERCTNLEAFEPTLVYGEVRPCPTTGRMCCLEDVETFQCGLLNLSRCGASGYYEPGNHTIHLPQGCSAAFRHEAIHHLLYVNGRADWKNHSAPEFRCQSEPLL